MVTSDTNGEFVKIRKKPYGRRKFSKTFLRFLNFFQKHPIVNVLACYSQFSVHYIFTNDLRPQVS